MEISLASLKDLDGVMDLHRQYHVDTISTEDKREGFVTTNFTEEQLKNLVEQEKGITIAKKEGAIVSYAMAASWRFWSEWPFFANMIKELPSNTFEGRVLTEDNSYQYGPICVHTSVRGTGVFEKVFDYSLNSMADRFPIMVTFINKVNPRSYTAHTKKALMKTVGTFEYNNNNYYMLACETNR